MTTPKHFTRPTTTTTKKGTTLSVLLIFFLFPACRPAATENKPPNFGVVSRGIYRGGQATSDQLEYLHGLGVRTILKLNSHGLSDERDASERLGMRLVHISLDETTVGKPESCEAAASAVAFLADRSNWPVYVHCSRGRDRTGYVIGVYRERLQNWDWKKVDEELTRYGHGTRMRRAYPQISDELKKQFPSCTAEIEKALSTTSP